MIVQIAFLSSNQLQVSYPLAANKKPVRGQMNPALNSPITKPASFGESPENCSRKCLFILIKFYAR